MANITLPHFGSIDPTDLEEYYDASIDLNGTSIEVDLNFDEHSIDTKRLEMITKFIDNLRIHDLNNKKHIESDFNKAGEGTVKLYVEHHLEELGENELGPLINTAAPAAEQQQQLVKKIQLVRLGLYPESTGQFATFDYSIGKDITDQLVVIVTDENGNLEDITMES